MMTGCGVAKINKKIYENESVGQIFQMVMYRYHVYIYIYICNIYIYIYLLLKLQKTIRRNIF